MSRPGRIACCVPFCRRTAAEEKHPNCTEIICEKHWRLLPKPRRRVYTRVWRAWDRAVARQVEPGSYGNKADWIAARRAAMRCARLWRAMKRQIIEAAAGIGGGP